MKQEKEILNSGEAEAYKKIRLEEARFNSREELEEAAEDVYQKQIRTAIGEMDY